MQFLHNWFGNLEPTWQALFDRVQPANYLEIGSFDGQSTCFAIKHIGMRTEGKVVCIDPWDDISGFSEAQDMDAAYIRFESNVAESCTGLLHKVYVESRREKSETALPFMLASGDKNYDVVYIDGMHTAAAVMFDAVLAFQLVRVGGLLIFDDYLWGKGGQPYNPADSPKMAIDAFTTAYMDKLSFLNVPLTQMCVVKQKD